MNIAWAVFLDHLLVGILGALVSAGELVARYKDEPWSTLRSPPALFYMGINAVAAVGALVLIRGFGWTFGGSEDTAQRITQILVAGFGSMAVFRSSLFTIRVGDRDVSVGPSSFLQIALDAADREVDRLRATYRSRKTKEVMGGISFDKAMDALPTYAIALMQNLPEEYQAQLVGDVDKLEQIETIDKDVKSLILGLAVMNYVGEDVLETAVKSLDQYIKAEDEAEQED